MEISVFRRVRTLAVPTLVLGAMTHGHVHAADGTIHFMGAIVAGPYELTHQAAAPPTGVIRRGPHGEVVFERQWVDRPSARVRVSPLGAHAFDLGFTDSRGRKQSVEALGELAVGRDGGRLSLARRASPQASEPAAVLLTVAYD